MDRERIRYCGAQATRRPGYDWIAVRAGISPYVKPYVRRHYISYSTRYSRFSEWFRGNFRADLEDVMTDAAIASNFLIGSPVDVPGNRISQAGSLVLQACRHVKGQINEVCFQLFYNNYCGFISDPGHIERHVAGCDDGNGCLCNRAGGIRAVVFGTRTGFHTMESYQSGQENDEEPSIQCTGQPFTIDGRPDDFGKDNPSCR